MLYYGVTGRLAMTLFHIQPSLFALGLKLNRLLH